MTAKVVTCPDLTGDVGKTTSCTTLVTTSGRRRCRVPASDADKGKPNAVRHCFAAPDAPPLPITVAGPGRASDTFGRGVKKYIRHHDSIFIDCPGAAGSPAHKSAFRVSDLVVVPVTLSSLDIRAAVSLQELFEDVEEDNPRLKKLLVPNQVVLRSRLARDTLNDMLPNIGIPLSQAHLGFRDAFKEAPNEGLPVQDLGRNAAVAAQEVDSMVDEILNILEGEK